MTNKLLVFIAFVLLILGIYFLIHKSPSVIPTNQIESQIQIHIDSIDREVYIKDTVFIKQKQNTKQQLNFNHKHYENFRDSIYSASFDTLFKFIKSEYSKDRE